MNDHVSLMRSGPAPSTPRREPLSIRRTSTIDTSWPDGLQGLWLQQGRARDILTSRNPDRPQVVAEDSFTAHLSPERVIQDIAVDPPRPGIGALVGARAGGQLRKAINEALPDEREQGTPLYLLLDDIAGSSLVAPWAWSRWDPDWADRVMEGAGAQERRQSMAGICIGFSVGSAALVDGGPKAQQDVRPVDPIDAGDDPHGWHRLAPLGGAVTHRRARRIDVRLQGEKIAITAHFQDSATSPSGQLWAVHEYLLTATADRENLTLTSIVADPRVLPYDQCPSAILNIGRLVGTPLAGLRRTVLTELAREEGCTHLNDMVRSLAEVPQLAATLAADTAI